MGAETRAAAPTAVRDWPVWSTTARVVVTRPETLDAASAMLGEVLDAVDAACSRFTPTSELQLLRPELEAGAEVSPLLAKLVRVALRAAHRSGGSVDPTLGGALARLGYDRDFERLGDPVTPAALSPELDRALGVPVITLSTSIPGWRRIGLSVSTGVPVLTVPADLTLDLGATAKAFAADLAARRIAENLGTGVLVALGGDIATAGPAPEGGWQVGVEDLPGDPSCQVTLAAGRALATSSTQKRRWRQHGETLHHIIDPGRGLPAEPVWRTVTVAAASCVEANTLSTASVVRGRGSVSWLAQQGATARLVDRGGRVLSLGGWPDENSVHVRAAG